MDSDGGMNHIAPLRCWVKCTVEGLPGEAAWEKSRGSDLGFVGRGILWHSKNQRILASPIHGSPNVALCRRWWPGPARPCCHLTAGRRGGLAPRRWGIFHHKHRVTVGPMGPFHCCRPRKQKDLILKSCPPSSTWGGDDGDTTRGSKGFPKAQDKDTDTSQKGAGAGAAGPCPAPDTAMGEAEWGGSEDTQGQIDKITCKENTAWSWGQTVRASPGRCTVRTLEQKGVLRPHGAHIPIPIPSCRNPGPGPASHYIHTTPVVSAPSCYGLSVKCIFQTGFNSR